MANSAFPVVKGHAMRLTKVGNCALPVREGKNSIVTDGFISVGITNVMKDAEDLEQTNAQGEICVADRTAAQLKWHEVTITMCNVDPEILGFLTANPIVLDYANKPVGFRSTREVRVDSGAALELWSGIGGADCVEPESDDVFESAAVTGGRSYGYFLLPWIKEAVIGDIEVGASVLNLTITGITGAPSAWGRGPYNVVEESAGVAGRLLTPMSGENHMHVQRTAIAPPKPTDGAVEFEDFPTPYFTDATGGGDDTENP